MATISININGMDVGFTLPDEDAGRILVAHTKMFTNDPASPPAPQDVVKMIAQQVITQLAHATLAREQQEAASAVPGIQVSIAP